MLHEKKIWSVFEMLEIKGKPFVDAGYFFGRLNVILSENPDDIARRKFGFILNDFIEQCEQLDIPLTILAANRLKIALDSGEVARGDVSNQLAELKRRLADELGSAHLLSLTMAEAKQYKVETPPFGESVSRQFPSIIGELSEASKCAGLGRNTAAAFHYLRAMEAGIRAVSRSLGIADPTRGHERNWSNIIKKINAEMDSRWPPNQRLGGDSQFFQGIISRLSAMQNPYRNETMHLDATYNQDEVREIAELAGGLMRAIAERMDEDGNPKA